LSRASISIDVKDDYLFSARGQSKNIELLAVFEPYVASSLNLRLRLLGSSQDLPRAVTSDVRAFLHQFPNVTIQGYSRSESGDKESHDRFIVIDGEQVFVTGASIKDLGLAQSLIDQIQDAEVARKYNNYLKRGGKKLRWTRTKASRNCQLGKLSHTAPLPP
jgi:hypothetical protein